jgi:hypothetical protein
MTRLYLLAVPAILLAACAAIQLNPGAERVRLTNQEPQGCEYLGDVVGTQGNAMTGGLTSNETLITGARNDIKNKAAAMGGNVVQILTSTAGHTSGQNGGGMSSSHLEGVAFRCPETKVPPEATAPAK